MINRDKGEVQKIKNAKTNDGKKYHLVDGIHPVKVGPEIKIDEGKKTFHINATDEKELRHIVKQLKKKYPGLDDKNLEEKWQVKKEYMNEPLHIPLVLGGDDFSKAVMKIAVNFYLFSGGTQEYVSQRINDLKDDKIPDKKIVHHYYVDNWMENIQENEVSHNILISGNKESKLLLAYVEIFSSLSYVVMLSDDYDGENIEFSYLYDLLENKILTKDLRLQYRNPWNEDLAVSNKRYIKILQAKMNRLMFFIDERSKSLMIKYIVKDATKKILGKAGAKGFLNEQLIHELALQVAKDVVPFIMHINNR